MKDLKNLRDAIDELNIKTSCIQKDLYSLRQNLLDIKQYLDCL